ncbi:MAG: hypothetical protein ABI790_11935 [Betaproteobacteria bacterium]
MKTEQKPADQATGNRRKFLLGATLGSAGAIAAVATGGNVSQAIEAVAAAPAKKAVKGYHETDHIRQYYETTRI